MRVGLSVGASVSPSPPRAASSAHTTRARTLSLSLGSLVRLAGETTDASSLSDQVKRYKPRVFEREPVTGPVRSCAEISLSFFSARESGLSDSG